MVVQQDREQEESRKQIAEFQLALSEQEPTIFRQPGGREDATDCHMEMHWHDSQVTLIPDSVPYLRCPFLRMCIAPRD